MKDLLSIARSYKGTPHINGASAKNYGVDCCTLITLIYKEMGIIDIPISTGYSNNWYCAKNCKELVLPYLDKYFDRVDELQPMDIISYTWGRSKYAHLSMYLGNGLYIHAHADFGVEIVDAECPFFFNAKGESRISGKWRLKHEFI